MYLLLRHYKVCKCQLQFIQTRFNINSFDKKPCSIVEYPSSCSQFNVCDMSKNRYKIYLWWGCTVEGRDKAREIGQWTRLQRGWDLNLNFYPLGGYVQDKQSREGPGKLAENWAKALLQLGMGQTRAKQG